MDCNIVSSVSEHIEKTLDNFLRSELIKLYPDEDFSTSDLQNLKEYIRHDNLTLHCRMGLSADVMEYALYKDEKEINRIQIKYEVMQKTRYPFVFLRGASV